MYFRSDKMDGKIVLNISGYCQSPNLKETNSIYQQWFARKEEHKGYFP